MPIPFRIEQLTSINDSMVIDAPVIADILPEFMKFCEGCVMVAHNADFDMSFIKKNCQRLDDNFMKFFQLYQQHFFITYNLGFSDTL